MGWYSNGEYRGDPFDHRVMRRYEPPPLPETIIACAACDERAYVRGVDYRKLEALMTLWLRGWRRDPVTELDYCPTHAA